MNKIQTQLVHLKPKLALRYVFLAGLIFALYIFQHAITAHAACAAPSTDYGSVTSTVNVPLTGSYRAWSRIMAPDATNNSYSLEVDGGSCYVVGDSAIAANTWTWVDYQNGNASSKIDLSLSAGNHTLKFIGREADVKLDRFILASDTSCIPSGTGDNCASDTTSPTTSITVPANNATIVGTVSVTANASDDIGVTKVELWVDGVLKGSPDTTAPYSFSWDSTTASNGSHSLTTKAYDAANNTTTSTAVNVTVNNIPSDTTTPTTSITAPSANANLSGTTSITANASDNVAVTKVEFYRGATLLGTDTTNPYSFSWNTTTSTDGNYSLTTKAYDAANNIGTSTAVNVVVDNTAPATTITSPAASAALSGTTNVTATGTDNNTVSKVELYIDGVLGATDVASPYIFSWNTTTATNGSHSLTTKAYDAAGNITTSAAVSVTVDNSAPTTSITSPAASASLAGTATVNASAADNISVTKVEFYVDGTINGAADSIAPYSFSWNTTTATNGSHSLTTKAYDAAGNITTSAAVSVTVDNSAPTTSITSPTAGATVSGTTSINANASDNAAVTKVEFYRGGTTLLGFDNSSPYSYSWDTAAIANGAYSLTTKAYDAAGNITTSAAVSVTVNNIATPPPDTTAPTVSVTAPNSGATIVGSTAVNVSASDNVGVTKVELYIDDVLTGSPDTTAPYAFNWVSSTVADGSHTIKTKAYDAAGNSTMSIAVTITVANAAALKSGDVNGDGKIDIFDLSILARYWLSTGLGRAQGDLNGDGVINIFDLSILATNWGK